MKDLKEDLLHAIEVQMQAEDLSQAEIARRIGARRTNVNPILKRKANATIDFLVKIAEGIGLEVKLDVRRK